MMRLSIFSITLLTMCLVFTVTPKVQAAVAPGCDKSSAFLGLPVWYKYLNVEPEDKDPCAITGPKNAEGGLDIQKAIPRVGLAVVEILLRIAGMVAVAFVIYGGFKFVTSQGEPEAYKTAQRTIINALIGVAISVLAVTIVSVIGGAIL